MRVSDPYDLHEPISDEQFVTNSNIFFQKNQLFVYIFFSMFPETVTEYLEEQAEELAGKPAALERFITEHLVISLLDNARPNY